MHESVPKRWHIEIHKAGVATWKFVVRTGGRTSLHTKMFLKLRKKNNHPVPNTTLQAKSLLKTFLIHKINRNFLNQHALTLKVLKQ